MDYHVKKYAETLSKAIPASGYRPQTHQEWVRLQRAMIDASYYYYRGLGATKTEAKRMARVIHGGLAGRLLLQMSFAEPEYQEVAQ